MKEFFAIWIIWILIIVGFIVGPYILYHLIILFSISTIDIEKLFLLLRISLYVGIISFIPIYAANG